MTEPGPRPTPKAIGKKAKATSTSTATAPGLVKPFHNPMPSLVFATLFSAAWVVGWIVLAGGLVGGIEGLAQLDLSQWALIAVAVALPLTGLWSYVLNENRTQALKAEMLSQMRNLSRAKSGSSALSEPIVNTEANRHLHAISDELEQRIHGFEKMTDNLSSLMVDMTARMEAQNYELDQISTTVSKRSSDVSENLLAQSQQLEAAEAKIDQMLTRVQLSVDAMTQNVENVQEQVQRPIVEAAQHLDEVMATISREVTSTNKALESLNRTHDLSITKAETARAQLAEEGDALRLASEGAVANIESLSVKLADQINALDSVGLHAAREIAEVHADFAQQASQLESISTSLGSHVERISSAIAGQNDQLFRLEHAAAKYGDDVAEQTKRNATVLLDETAKMAALFEQTLDSQLSSLKSNIDARRDELETQGQAVAGKVDTVVTRAESLMDRLSEHATSTLEDVSTHYDEAIAKLSDSASEMAKAECENLDGVKERIAATVDKLRVDANESAEAMCARAAATAQLLDAQSLGLSKRLDEITQTSQSLHRKLSEAADDLGKQLVEKLEDAVLAQASSSDSGVQAVQKVLDDALNDWNQRLTKGLEDSKSQMNALVQQAAADLEDASQSSVDKLIEVGSKLPQMSVQMVQSAEEAKQKLNNVTDDLNAGLESVLSTAEVVSQATNLFQRDIDDAPQKLALATRGFKEATQILASSSESATGYAQRLQQSAQDLINHGTETNQIMGEAVTVTTKLMADQKQALSQGIEEIVDLTANFTHSIQAETQKAEQNLAAMANLSEATVGAVTQTSQSVGGQIQDFTRQAGELRLLLENIGGVASQHGVALQKVGEQAEARALRLMSLVNDNDRDAFLGSAERLVDRLHGLAVDVDSILDGDLDPSVIAAFQQGDRGISVRRLLATNAQSPQTSRVAQLYASDERFRTRVDHYVEGFDDLLMRAARADTTKLLHTTFLTADIGKLYVFLTRSLGLLAAAE